MKKSVKVILIVIGIFIGVVLLDTLQARIFKHSPFISWKEELADEDSWVDRGIIIDTFYCTKEQDIVTVSWHFNTSKFTCPIDNVVIEELKNIQDKIIDRVSSKENYTNFASCYVDKENSVVVVELVNNSKENQEWFKKNIIDSKYIKFNQGGPYTTSNDE